MTHLKHVGDIRFILALAILNSYSFVHGTNDGLYVSNGTDILYMTEDSDAATGLTPEPISLYHKGKGRIVGLAVDIAADLIFWSDISREHLGIYKASLNDGSQLMDIQQLISSDIVEVNGLAVDWESRHIYWTDAKKRTVEICEYDGRNRRVLGLTSLLAPRGIYSDPVSGYIFWDDQISGTIERSRPDGSDQRTIVHQDVVLPNQLLVHRSKLYWVDSNDKDVWRSNLDGTAREKLGSVSRVTLTSNIFGIALNPDGMIYVGAWERGEVVALTVGDQKQIRLESVVPYRMGTGLFSMAYYSRRNIQPSGSNPCNPSRHKYGCSHLCLPTGSQSARCSCPSYGGLTLSADSKTCSAPQEVLLFALAGRGEVAYVDTGSPEATGDLYLVGHSLRPVAVAYDSVEQMVYWSDVHEKRIHRAKLDGSQHSIFLSMKDGIGIVDGMTIDVKNRMLYYTNLGVVVTGGAPYSWHKIEVIGLSGGPIRTIITDAEKPRALWVDAVAGHLYYTDWGTDAKVMRTRLDGSYAKVIQKDLENPNGVTVQGSTLYVIDSHYKSRQGSKTRFPSRNATIASVNINSDDWRESDLPFIHTPYAIAARMVKNPGQSKFYVTDWETKSIISLSKMGDNWRSVETILENVDAPMGIVHSYVSTSLSDKTECESRGMSCDEVCLSGSDGSICSCSSYTSNILDRDSHSCVVPKEWLIFADMSSIKLIGYDSDDRSVYNTLMGNEYLDNYVAVAYDAGDQGIYYSDVSGRQSRGIYFQKLDGTGRRMVFQGNSIIDGMAIDPVKKQLYWSDYLSGEIVTMATNGDPTSKRTLIRALKSPRAVQIDTTNGYLYWTEWGDRPRVARILLQDPGSVETLVSADLKEPNGLSLDVPAGKMYIGDGFYKKILECNLDGSECRDLPYVHGVADHIFDVVKAGDFLFYSDWVQKTVSQINMNTGQVSIVADNLMRPTKIITQFIIKKDCPSDNRCEFDCMATPGGYQCLCDVGHTLKDNYTCTAVERWKPSAAVQCRDPCGKNAACARQIGGRTVVYECQCLPGYVMRSVDSKSTCVACEVNTYKEYIGDDGECRSCPEPPLSTPVASSQCACPRGLYWHSAQVKCIEEKMGMCADIISARFMCNPDCEYDHDCPGAQKCCAADGRCADRQCVDAIYLSSTCAVDGKLYNEGEKFMRTECNQCTCMPPRSGDRGTYIICTVMNCPILLCKEEDQIIFPGQCCKTCTQTIKLTKNITIDNCPSGEETLILPLEYDSRYAKDFTSIQVVDRTGLDRSVNVTKDPPGVFYEWTGGAVDVTWSAASQRTSGDWDVTVCSYSLTVQDLIPPTLICPDDVIIYTPEKEITVKWLPPRSTDNVGLAAGYPKVVSGQRWAGVFSTGDHLITYLSKDLSQNENQCSFKVIVHQLSSAQCDVMSPHHGTWSCVDAGSGIVACQLHCNMSQGYVMNPVYGGVYQYECSYGEWTPDLPKSYMVDACVEITPRTIKVKNVFSYQECLPGLSVVEAELDLFDRVRRAINLMPGGEYITVHVQMLNLCKQPAQVTANLTLSTTFRSEEQGWTLKKHLEDVLQSITTRIKSGEIALVRALVLGTHFYVKPDSNVLKSSDIIIENIKTRQGCFKSQPSSTDGCMVCPEGMYLSDKAVCEVCTENTYTDQVNEKECRPCSNSTVSPEASYTRLLCRSCLQDHCAATMESTGSSSPSVMILGIIIAATVVVIIVIVVVLVIVIRKWRKPRRKTPGDSRGTSFTNPTFGEVTISEDPKGQGQAQAQANNNDNKPRKIKNIDKGSVRSTASTSSAMARAYPFMPDKEVEIVLEKQSNKITDHTENPYF